MICRSQRCQSDDLVYPQRFVVLSLLIQWKKGSLEMRSLNVYFSFILGKLINVFVFSLTDTTQVVVLCLFFRTGVSRKI